MGGEGRGEKGTDGMLCLCDVCLRLLAVSEVDLPTRIRSINIAVCAASKGVLHYTLRLV